MSGGWGGVFVCFQKVDNWGLACGWMKLEEMCAYERLISFEQWWKGFTTDLYNYEGFYWAQNWVKKRVYVSTFFFKQEWDKNINADL